MPPPIITYLTAGFWRAGGVEVYLLHYATELRRQGFDTRIVVFDPLPRREHWCLREVRQRGIPIESLAAPRAVVGACAAGAWFVSTVRRRRTAAAPRAPEVAASVSERQSPTAQNRSLTLAATGGRASRTLPGWAAIRRAVDKRLQLRALRRLLRRSPPDLVHVKGRLIAEAWDALPAERTIYHVATGGQRDPSWEPAEAEAFRAFVQSCARVFAPGSGVAERFRQDFGITRPVEVVFTMAPEEGEEEGGGWGGEGGGQRAEVGRAREEEEFGDRRQETADCRPQTADCRPQTADRRPETGDRRLETGDHGRRASSLHPPPHTLHPPARLRFGFLGRLHEEKGLTELLEALAMLKREGHDVPFLFAGEGPMEAAIRARTARDGLAGARIEPVTRPAASIAGMDVLVLPSRSEAMPLVIVEAFMCGRPCIATAVGGVTDLVRDGVEGFLIPPNSAAAVAEAIRRFAAMPADAFAGFCRRARARYEDCCTPARVGAQVAGRYRAVMARRQ